MPPKRKQQQPKKQTSTQRKRSRKSKSSPKTQDFTELSAISHVLSDQVHQYAMENPLSVGELRHLSAWDNAVATQVHRHNSLVIENVQLTAEFKKSNKRISNLRDDLVVLRASQRRKLEETSRLQEEYKQHDEKSSTLKGASRFLTAIETIGKACRESNKSGSIAKS